MEKESKKNGLPTLWPYRHDDSSTWPYIDCKLSGQYGNLKVSYWIKNPDFKYGHLIKGYRECR